MDTILVATDFSERSDRALRRAILLAKKLEAQIELVHVVDDDQPKRIVESERVQALEYANETAATLRTVDGVNCQSRVLLADPFAGIVLAVKETTPDLLVLGPHRRQLLRDVFVGTTAERTIRSVSCPVLMVNAPPVGSYKHILQTTDISACSKVALQRFAGLGLGSDVRSSILHVFHAPAMGLAMGHSASTSDLDRYLEQERGRAAQVLLNFLAGSNISAGEHILRQAELTPSSEILRVAQEGGADLVVLGAHSRSAAIKFFLGSVTEQVLSNSSIDSLVIPPAPTQ